MRFDLSKPRHPLTRWTVAAILFALGTVSAHSPASAARKSSDSASPAAVHIPRLNFRQTLLPNGLKVVTLEDSSAPVATVQVVYQVGSKDEAPGKSGFAHLFEHLMFKGSAHVLPEQHGSYVEQVGGIYNADTAFDRTRYYETVPSSALDRMLWLEADRMASLRVDEPNLKSERAVVEEELRLRVTNAPYGTSFTKLLAMVYPSGTPYAHPTIGSIPDLESAALADVQAFHDMYYKPDNATLIVVGDFKTADALMKIRRYFGAIPRSTQPFQRYPNPDPGQMSERRDSYTDPLAPLPRVTMAYRLPPVQGADTPVFQVISTLLSQGSSSRLYRSLVREKQLALQATGRDNELKLGGVFQLSATVAPGRAPDEVEKAMEEQIDLLRTQPVSDAALAKTRSQLLSDRVFRTISTTTRADVLGQADLLYGTPDEANRSVAKLTAVTAADIQRVAAHYFEPARRSVLWILAGANARSRRRGETK